MTHIRQVLEETGKINLFFAKEHTLACSDILEKTFTEPSWSERLRNAKVKMTIFEKPLRIPPQMTKYALRKKIYNP